MKFKKITSFILVFTMLFSIASTVNASNHIPVTKVIDNEKVQLLYSLDAKDKSPEEIEQETEKLYKEFGIFDAVNKVRRKREAAGLKLRKQEVYVKTNLESKTNAVIENVVIDDYVNLSDYKGYGMRYVIVNDIYDDYDEVDLTDVADDPVVEILDDSFSVCLGLLPPWVWIPATFLGVKASDISKWILCIDDARRPKLIVRPSEELTHKYYEIEDLDNKIDGYDWYCFRVTNKTKVYLDMILTAWDKNNKRIKPYTKTRIKHFYGKYYSNTSTMKKKVYEAYKHGNEIFYDLTERVKIK